MKNNVAMIPARMGSERLKEKNLALIDGKPMIYYAIIAAKDSGLFSKIVVNGDDEIFGQIAKRYDVEFYSRPKDLGSANTKSDEIVYDFICNNGRPEFLTWVNPVNPFQKPEEIIKTVKYFFKNSLDSLFTCQEKFAHCMYNNDAVNFNISEKFSKTQDLNPLQILVCSTMIWRTRSFESNYTANAHAMISGKFGVYPVSDLAALNIKNKDDLILADFIMKNLRRVKIVGNNKIKYDKLIKD